ncbi:MAG TPA: helix-turn-helix transcriptional regulator [Candidatus Hydrogenedentes bacterium]|jgi:predicted XRE-type DNA-binding protein|nr:XRE family transcriptional regulator [Candidatus Hydrogenedentota bacterium]OQC05444.1 MAG: Helix-turn-helix domain protein [Candidatus Hydrogenedentes bacterium ADurb.Bin101]HOH30499.1 helix-turn-helix transcriptional regulator [Candidatus Hydrogenedentota bacterium]HQM99579.1 helix-turn-helix transcriptional regulator [Candidatus Hydrogenedentota bacterium]
MSDTILDSCGNVFLDLGLPPDEAAILQIRADLMAELRKFIKRKKLSQTEAARLLAISESRLSDLLNGKWEQFSLEMLVALATRAGMHVHLKTAA